MRQFKGNFTILSVIGILFCLISSADHRASAARLTKRWSPLDHKHMMHNHLSRKVFERACAASKDTIDEIIGCMTGNQSLIKAIKPETAFKCHKDAFGIEFDPLDMVKHKEIICNNREKFEEMTTCVYKTATDGLGQKEIETLTEALVDVGLCIINALDG